MCEHKQFFILYILIYMLTKLLVQEKDRYRSSK